MNELLLYWFLYVSTSAAVGAFMGTLTALGVWVLFKKTKGCRDGV